MDPLIIIEAQIAQYTQQLEDVQQKAIGLVYAIGALEETKAQLEQAAAADDAPAEPAAQ